MSTTPPNWYPDPEQAGQERWWDGEKWTDDRRPAGAADAPPPMDPGAPPPAANWDAPPPPVGGQSWETPQNFGQPAGGAYVPAGAKVSPHGVPLADLGKRFGAFLLDGVVGFVVFFVLFIVAGILGAILGDTIGGLLAIVAFIGGFAAIVVMAFMAEGRTGQSYGKHVLDIAVVGHDTGRPIGTWPAVGRNFIRGIGSSIYVLFLGVLWATWDDKRQGWHDKALKTLVIEHPTATMNPIDFFKYVLNTPAP